MICSVGHQLAPLDENGISGILGAGPGRAALSPIELALILLRAGLCIPTIAPRHVPNSSFCAKINQFAQTGPFLRKIELHYER
jgi:hypothetical protein